MLLSGFALGKREKESGRKWDKGEWDGGGKSGMEVGRVGESGIRESGMGVGKVGRVGRVGEGERNGIREEGGWREGKWENESVYRK